MTVVQDALIDGVVNYIDSRLAKAKVKINGEYLDYTVNNTIVDGRKIRKYITLDTEKGFIEEAQLLSESGEVLAKKAFSVNKEKDGVALVFEITVSLQEG